MKMKSLFLLGLSLAALNGWSMDPTDDTLLGYREIECTISPVVRKSDSTRGKRGAIPLGHTVHSIAGSYNWSGYACAPNLDTDAPGSVYYAQGDWKVPKLLPTADVSYSSIWVGIDGFTNTTVEQLGTEHDWESGIQYNYAWFEMYPGGSYSIDGFPVDLGDEISAQIAYKGEGIFKMVMFNHTKKVTSTVPTSMTTSMTAERSCAEWVVEAPYYNAILPLADFQLATFNYCSAAIAGTKTGPINDPRWQNDEIIMINSKNQHKATPSELLKNGTCFQVTWNSEN